jgi:hypothetical protein
MKIEQQSHEPNPLCDVTIQISAHQVSTQQTHSNVSRRILSTIAFDSYVTQQARKSSLMMTRMCRNM